MYIIQYSTITAAALFTSDLALEKPRERLSSRSQHKYWRSLCRLGDETSCFDFISIISETTLQTPFLCDTMGPYFIYYTSKCHHENVTMRMRFDRTAVLRTEPTIKFQGRWHDMADQLSNHPKRELPLKNTSLKYLNGYNISSHETMMSFPRHIQSSWQSNWPKSNCADYPHDPGCGHG